jgi:hypothetical protein
VGDDWFAPNLGFSGFSVVVCHNLCWPGVICFCYQFVDLDYTRVHITYVRNLHVKGTNTMFANGKVVTLRLPPTTSKINPFNG